MHIQGFSDHVIPVKWVDFKENEEIELKLSIPVKKKTSCGELEPLPVDQITSLEYLSQISLNGLLVHNTINIPSCVKRVGFDHETSNKLGWTSLSGWTEIVFKPKNDLSEILSIISSIYEIREPPIRCPRLVGACLYLSDGMNKGLPSDIYRVKGIENITLCAKVQPGNDPNCPYR
jgi:hypothetical protein